MRHLRPVERRVLRMRDEGVEVAEIGRRIRKSSESVERIIAWTDIPRSKPPIHRSPSALERRVLALRNAGETHEQVGRRFGRSANYIRQVEGFAHYRLGRVLLGGRNSWPDSQ